MDVLNKDKAQRNTSIWNKTITVLLDLRKNRVFNYVMLALLGVVTGLVSLLLGATVFGLPLFRDYFQSPVILLLNLLPPVLLIFLIYFISGRAWIAFAFPASLTIALSIVQFYKVPIHSDPFIWSDVIVAREAITAFSDMKLEMNWKIYLAIMIFVCGVLFSVFFLKRKPANIPLRIIAAVAIVAISAGLYTLVYSDTKLYDEVSVRVEGAAYSATRRYVAKGFLYPFIHSVYNALSERIGIPDWYDAKTGRQLREQYVSTDIPVDKKVNVISLLLESYVDFTQFDALNFEVDIYAPLHKLQDESVTGMVVTNTFAGWTVDSERLFLTGNTQFVSYKKATNSYVYYFRDQGYHTEGLHSGEGWFYDRRSISRYLGFDNYYFREDFENGSNEDSFFFQAVLDLYEARDRSKPYFSYNLSFQNHVGFDSAWMLGENAVAQGELSDESYEILTNYLAGIYDTTWRLESFINSLRDDPEPVVVVIFGDHMPWLGPAESVYTELGINIDRSTEEGLYNHYSTPYLIWANDAAKETLGNDFIGDGGSFSPCFLMGELFDLCSWKGDSHMQTLRELKGYIDVVNAYGVYRENGVLTTELSHEAGEAYRRYRQMEIYRRENFK